MAGLRLNHGLTSQNGYEELSYKCGKILIWASVATVATDVFRKNWIMNAKEIS
jgi:hypothetical protein